MEEEKQINYMQTVESTTKMSKTAGGYECIIADGLTIRKSSEKRILEEDGETKVEYKLRLKLLFKLEQDLKKEKQKNPNYVHMSRFNIKGQNYVSTYVKPKEEEKTNK